MVYLKLEKTDFEVLRFLIENLFNEYSIKEISDRLKRPYVKVHNSIERLTEKKIIIMDVKGKSHYCSIDYKNNIDVVCFINSQKSKEFLFKNKKIRLYIEDITQSIKIPNYILLLFGSYAKGSFNKTSDLDIAIITSDENKEEIERLINSKKRLLSLDIHSFEFTYNEFIEMLKSREMNVGKNIVKDNIIFKGYEQFYNCIILSE
jgi:predicted nucleotidyltransferase